MDLVSTFKTIKNSVPEEFDEELNQAYREGWGLNQDVKFRDGYLVAFLTRYEEVERKE